MAEGPRSGVERESGSGVRCAGTRVGHLSGVPAFAARSRLTIRASGRDAELISTGEDNLIWQTALKVAADVGRVLTPIELEIVNDIPIGKGLGSSAAALTAGVVIAAEMLELGWSRAKVLDEAARIEGHPDNVAACVLGSIVASALDGEGVARAVRMEIDSHYGVAVVVPDFLLPTVEARRVLPMSYTRADAVFNVQRSALLIAALTSGSTDAFPEALEDRLHQPYRFRAGAGVGRSDEIARAGAAGVRAERRGSVDSGVLRARSRGCLRAGARGVSRSTGMRARLCGRRSRRRDTNYFR